MPNMFNTYPKAELETVYHIPRTPYEETEKEIKDYRFLNKKDDANTLLGLDDFRSRDKVL